MEVEHYLKRKKKEKKKEKKKKKKITHISSNYHLVVNFPFKLPKYANIPFKTDKKSKIKK
jgi:hypothetical protein